MDPSTETLRRSTFEIEQHVRQLSDDWVKAILRADAATLDRIMADDFFLTYPLEGDDKEQFIADVMSGDFKFLHFQREQLSVRVFGQTAVLTARDSATWLYHGRELVGQYKIISVFAERDGRWQLCAVQACPMQQTG
ncbi:MAG TPA: nuclear transport factor 2 family protein [Pyrinomonadaceae bacterium]|nr:nuclear transport factor 2 family protein [Pyrinomonadaceae bacterium]